MRAVERVISAAAVPTASSQQAKLARSALPQAVVSSNAGHEDTRSSHDFYTDLRLSVSDGEACAFVGAGMSIGAGLPSWYDLIGELAARVGDELPPAKYVNGDTLIDAAQTYVNRQGLNSLIRHLKDRLDTTGKQPSAAHRALAQLPLSLVFTANFDDLLERAFRDAGKRVEVVVRDSSIPFMRRGPNIVSIIKMYGDLDQPDTIVLARQQYESYFLQRPQMVKLLETELARSDTLYLGWSGSDPYYKLIFGELLARFGDMLRPGYAVMFDVSGNQREELIRKHIRLVELPAGERTERLAMWLAELGPVASGEPGPTSASRAAPAVPAPAPARGWNTAAIRDLLNAAFSDDGLTTLCFDYFQPVYDDFAAGMSKGQKIQRLLDYCVRQSQVETLLAAVQQANPVQYQRFADRLRG